jgi:hypothetical protein
VDHNTRGSTFDRIGGEKCEVLRLQWIVIGAFRRTRLGLRLAGQRRVVDFEAHRVNYPNVRWHSVASFHFDDVTNDEL